MKKIKLFLLISISISIIIIIAINIMITVSVKDFLYDDISRLPHNKTGIILGTSKFRKTGEINLYYKYRIDAASELYESGKINYILASGDNMNRSYNEPKRMRQDLIRKGVPSSAIYLDFAGFRTLDSVVRSKKIFNQKSITIISQKFHNQRAVFIARHFGIQAIGYNAADIHDASGFKTRVREIFARVKAVIDLYIIKQKPRFLGDKVNIK